MKVVVVALLLSAVAADHTKCPAKCLCFKTTVRCMFLQLWKIPEVPPNTTILDLRFNKIRHIPPNTFQHLKNLNTLLLNNNHITRLDNGVFNGLGKLRYLYLYKNRIRNIQDKVFHPLKSLEHLYLHFNDLRKIESEVFSYTPLLERLYLHFNEVWKINHESFVNLRRVKRLFLHNNRVQHIPRGTFKELQNLKRLRLDSNALVCDCQLMWLAKMVKEEKKMQVAATCEYPHEMQGKDLGSLSHLEHECRGHPEITQEPSDVKINFGGTAYFTCKVEGNPEPEVRWLHNNEEISPGPRYNFLHDNTLMIENTQERDDGYFECIAKNEMGEVKSRKAKISMHEITAVEAASRPQFIYYPEDVQIKEGGLAEIVCNASGDPRPDITWTKEQEPIVTGPRIQISNEGHLTFAITVREDSGLYRCTAANHLGRITATARLTVFISPVITKEPDDAYTTVGSYVEFNCDAEGVPPPVISWTFNEEPVKPDTRTTISVGGRSFRISGVTERDEGDIICKAQNDAGFVEADASLYVRNKVAPVLKKVPGDLTVMKGSDVVMPCKAGGLPSPTIQWTKDGHFMHSDGRHSIEDDGSLMVFNTTMDDSGLYECNAVNHLGYATARATLTVRDARHAALGDVFLEESFELAKQEIDRAVNKTVSHLFRRHHGEKIHPHELLRVFRFPSGDGLEIARSAEQIERTIHIVLRQLESGRKINVTAFDYKDLLSPDKLETLTRLSGCLSHRRNPDCEDTCFHMKYRSIDGTCNNLQHPLWGASLIGFKRLLSPVYENGVNTPLGWSKTKRYNGYFLPSARLVSTRLISAEGISMDEHCTHMLMQWGQFFDHDIDLALPSISTESFEHEVDCHSSCDFSAPCFPIEIPLDDHRIRHHRCMEFTRSSGICGSGVTSVFFNSVQPREQINVLTSYIDASQVYGSSDREIQALRNFSSDSGELRRGSSAPSGKQLMPFSNGAPIDCRRDLRESAVDCFLAGDIRANEQSGLLAMHTIWFREHNRITKIMRNINPNWDGDKIFHETRKILGAYMQHITYSHWLLHIIGIEGMQKLGEYKGYDPSVDATISNVFATAAFRHSTNSARAPKTCQFGTAIPTMATLIEGTCEALFQGFGHTLVSPILERLNGTFQPIPEGHLPLHRAFFAPWRVVEEGGIDPLIRGLFATPAKLKKDGQMMNTELTEKLFKAAHEIALDLAAVNIQRGRDHGIPGYLEWRKLCSLSIPNNFDDMREYIESANAREQLRRLYGHPGNIDAWVGGILESPVKGARIGPTLSCILIDQFKRLRSGDRFWYENPSVFKPEQLSQIKQITLARILCDNSNDIRDITKDVFVLPRLQNPAFTSCDVIPKVDFRVWTECCSNCEPTSEQNSIFSNFDSRFRRQVTHLSEQIQPAGNTDQFVSEQPVIVNETSYILQEEELNTPVKERLRNKTKRKNDRFLAEPYDGVSMVDQRMEGLELMLEKLYKTVNNLAAKVQLIEHSIGLHQNRRLSKTCKDESGTERLLGSSWFKGDCTKCSCRRHGMKCKVITCPELRCVNPIQVVGKCCPVC